MEKMSICTAKIRLLFILSPMQKNAFYETSKRSDRPISLGTEQKDASLKIHSFLSSLYIFYPRTAVNFEASFYRG